MVRKICPICDQVMSSSHYCSHCRSFVKEPYVRNSEYYLNERHPAAGHECEYHEENKRAEKKYAENKHIENKRAGYKSAPVPNGGKKQGMKKNTKVLLIIIAVFVALEIVLPLLFLLIDSAWFFL